MQAKLKKQGHPWEISKAFRGSAIIGPWIPIADFPEYLEEEFVFKLDGKPVQRGLGTQMTMCPDDALAYMDEHFPLCKDDVVFTGAAPWFPACHAAAPRTTRNQLCGAHQVP